RSYVSKNEPRSRPSWPHSRRSSLNQRAAVIRSRAVSKDLLEPETNLVQRPQRRDLLKEGLQRLLLLGTQTLGIAAEGPHLGPKGFSLVLGQLRLVFSSDIFSQAVNHLVELLSHMEPIRHGTAVGQPQGARR